MGAPREISTRVARVEDTTVRDDPVHRYIADGHGDFGDQLEIENDPDLGHGRPRERAVIISGAIADPVPRGIQRQGGDDHDIDLAEVHRDLGSRSSWFRESLAPIGEIPRVIDEVEGHRPGLAIGEVAGIDRRVGDADSARAKPSVERPQVHLAAVKDGPEQRNAPRPLHHVEHPELGDDAIRSLLAGGLRECLPDAPGALAELPFDAPSEVVLAKDVGVGRLDGGH